MVLHCAMCCKRKQVQKHDSVAKWLQTTFTMHSGACASSSNMPQSDTDSPLIPGSGNKEMETGGRQGEYGDGDGDDEDIQRANTGVTHILSCMSA